ncbi:MAG: HAD family hydrolase [Candidatus Xenobiia bacterium LiM19]
MIKAFLIDLFDTLVYLDEILLLNWREEMARSLNIVPGEFREFWWSLSSDRFTGRISSTEQMLDLSASHFGVSLDEKKKKSLSRRELECLIESAHLYPDTSGTLIEMRRLGYRTALVSNASYNAIPLLEHLSLTPLLDVRIISCQAGVAKPNPAIYRMALSELGLQREECLFVGDGACQELDGAHEAGIRAVRIVQDPQTSLFGKSSWCDFTIYSLNEVLSLAEKVR